MTFREKLGIYGLPVMAMVLAITGWTSGDAGALVIAVISALIWVTVLMMRSRTPLRDDDSDMV